MQEDISETIKGAQNKFEKLVSSIPGYAGYKRKEQRREADRLLRLHVARQYEAQLGPLNSVQQTLASRGDLSSILPLERAAMKLQLLIDRIKTASYGYAGLFDAIKVDEAALDRLYEFDLAMLDGAGRVSAAIANIVQAVEGEGSAAGSVNALISELEALNTTFSHRQDVILQ